MNIANFGYFYLLRPLFALVTSFYKVYVIGKENIPQDQGFILAANHSTFLDAPFIAYCLRPTVIHWIVAKGIYNTWYFRPLCIFSRSIPVNGSSKLAEQLLHKGEVIGIFPSGGLCCDRLIKQGRKGVAVLAKKTGAPVVPCYIQATLDPRKRVNILPKPFTPLVLIIGQPISFEKYPSEIIPQEILEEALSKIITGINALSAQCLNMDMDFVNRQ